MAQWVDPNGETQPSQVCDVSKRGVFLRFLSPGLTPVIGDIVVLSIGIPGCGLVTLRGTVRWVGASYSHQCSGMGIELNHANAALEAHLEAA